MEHQDTRNTKTRLRSNRVGGGLPGAGNEPAIVIRHSYFVIPVLLLAGIAAAAGPALNVQGVNRAEFWAFKQDWATAMEDKLDLNVKYGDLNGIFGLFMFEPSKPWDNLRKPLRLFDYTLAYSPKKFEVLYGKYFQTFGKGLALRSYQDDDFRHYKSLFGLRGTAKLPLRTDLVLLGGRLRDVFFQQNTYQILNASDTGDQVLGADLTTRPWKRTAFGGRYVRVNRSTDLTAKAFGELFGGNASAGIGPVEVYGEGCWRLGTKPGIGGRETGKGYYFNASFAQPGYSLLGEYMDYDKLAVPSGVYHYNDPPTPIKSGVAINRGVDEHGFGVTATATPFGPLYLEGVYGRLYTHDNTSAGVVEWEGKSRYSAGTAWTFEAKFNHMLQKNIELHVLDRVVDNPTVHVNWVGGQHTIAFEGAYGFVSETRDDPPQPGLMKYHETVVTLSYGYGANLLFTVGWQGVDKKLNRRYNDEVSWPLFETVWSITDRNILRVRIGSEKGGYTCSGGVCRFESPFTGVKVQLISRF